MGNNELSFVKDMFDRIAPKYDLLNRLLSMRFDIYWRSKMVSEANIYPKASVLDVACGTADVAIELIKQLGTSINVVGVDFSEKMLEIAKDKINNKLNSNIKLIAADAFYLPFTNKSFDFITMAFAIRNIKDRVTILKRFHSLLKKGGTLLILELSLPKKAFIRKIFMYYFKHILSKVGFLLSKDSFAYSYLPDSIINFPNNSEFTSIMIEAGFNKILSKRLTMGIVTLFIAYKL